MAFNRGEPFHGSELVSGGKLTGQTDTDYFYFLCPRCPEGEMVRILDFKVVQDGEASYAASLAPPPVRDFTIAFQIHCQRCGLDDFVKVSNTGWQGGRIDEQPAAGV